MKPQDVQILFADLQPPLVSASKTEKPVVIATAASVLAKAASILALPVTFTVVPENGGPGNLIKEITPYATDSTTFQRTTTRPFTHDPIVSALASHQRKVLVVAGFSAEVVVLHAALDALAAGYQVQVPIDAVGSRSERTERAALQQIEKAGGVITSVTSLLTGLASDFSQPPGSEIFAALSDLRNLNV